MAMYITKQSALNRMSENPDYKVMVQTLEEPRGYYLYKSLEELKRQGDNHLSEYMTENEPRRFYLDFEDYYEPGTFKSIDDATKRILFGSHKNIGTLICEDVRQALNKYIKDEDVYVAPRIDVNVRDYKIKDELKQKLSIHTIYYGAVFKNWEQMNTFVNGVYKNIIAKYKPNYSGSKYSGFDTNIYSRGQGFRIYNQTKSSDDKDSKFEPYLKNWIDEDEPITIPHDFGYVKIYGEQTEAFYNTDEIESATNTRSDQPSAQSGWRRGTEGSEQSPQSLGGVENFSTQKGRMGLLKALLDLLPADYTKQYKQYLNIMSVIYDETQGSDEGFDLACEVCRKAPGYEHTPDREYLQKWKTLKVGSNNMGHLYNILYALHGKEKVREAVKDNCSHLYTPLTDYVLGDEIVVDKEFIDMIWEGTEESIARQIQKNYGNTIRFSPKTGFWCLQKNNTWKSTGKEPKNYRTIVIDTFRPKIELLKKNILKNGKDGDQIFMNQLQTFDKMIGNSRVYSGVLDWLKEKVCDDTIDNRLDSIHNLLAFDDVVYDCDADTLRPIEPKDWITRTSEYNYNEDYDEEEYSNIQKSLKASLIEIAGGEEMYNYLIQEISTCLHGRRRISDVMTLTGSGGNGKGVLVSLICAMFGKHAVVEPVGLFQKKELDDRNPALLTLKGARFVVVNEPQREGQMSSLIKMLDGDEIKVRDNFAKSTDYVSFKATFGLYILCNHAPKFDGDGGVRRRLRAVPFKMEYRDNPIGNQKPKDPKIKENFETNPLYRRAFFELLRQAYQVYKNNGYKIDTPAEVLLTAGEMIETNNPINEWFCDNIQRTGIDTDRIEKGELYEIYRREQQKPISPHNFSVAMTDMNVGVIKSNGKRYYRGVKMIESADPEELKNIRVLNE